MIQKKEVMIILLPVGSCLLCPLLVIYIVVNLLEVNAAEEHVKEMTVYGYV